MECDLVVLTRDGCVNTPELVKRLDEALRALARDREYRLVDLAGLDAGDRRLGYPTPTVLVRNRDLFGLPEPVPPFPEPL